MASQLTRVRGGGMDRRRFVVLIGSALVAQRALSQQMVKVRQIGILGPLSAREGEAFMAVFVKGMHELGHERGKDFVLVERYADGKNDLLPALAAELVRLKVDVIFTSTVQAVSAAQKATASIPIVFVAVADPVRMGFADSVARPGRNLTGQSNFAGDLAPKRLELLKTLLPKLSLIAFLGNPGNPSAAGLAERMRASVSSLGLQMQQVNAGTLDDIDSAFATMKRERIGAVVVTGDVYHFAQRERIAAAAMKYRIASIFPFRECAEAGGLMSYGTDIAYQFWHAAAYVDKILKGARPGDLPIEQPANFELVINRKTASTIGLVIPQELLLRADRVIE
ncbi:MAG: ABC transporter substrate-binding protein [Betaproteobacteria bacterium]